MCTSGWRRFHISTLPSRPWPLPTASTGAWRSFASWIATSHYGLVVGLFVDLYDNPVDRVTRLLLLRTDDRDRAVSFLREIGCSRTQYRTRVAPDTDRAYADDVGVSTFLDERGTR